MREVVAHLSVGLTLGDAGREAFVLELTGPDLLLHLPCPRPQTPTLELPAHQLPPQKGPPSGFWAPDPCASGLSQISSHPSLP